MAPLWGETTGDLAIRIAILDAPVDQSHRSLASAKIDQRWLGHHAHCSAHGTEVASVIFASHNSPVLGIAPDCRGISVPIYECDPERSPLTDQRQLAVAIYEALASGAQVINISAGQLVAIGAAEPELADAVRDSAAAGVLIVAAVGNDGCDCLHVPASLPCVLAVGAMRRDGSPLPDSNWGAAYANQGILALGEDIAVADSDGGIELRTGTSYATAIVSGIVALLLSRERKRGRPPRPLLVRKALLAAARSVPHTGRDRRFLAGRLNINEAMHLLDTWSNTMTHETKLDLADECNSQSNGPDIRPVALSPSGEPSAAQMRPSHLPASPNTREPGDAVEPSACSTCRGERELVYALGQLSYDFGSEAGMDAFRQPMKTSPFDEVQMLAFLKKSDPWYAAALSWTVCIEGLPVYVIRPEGPFARDGYQRLVDFLDHKHDPNPKKRSERVAVAGVISGQATLQSGQQVPIINPDLRGLTDWNTGELIDEARKALGGQLSAAEKKKFTDEFLDRIYHELRNTGRTPRERALNYAATNLFSAMDAVMEMFKVNHTLDGIGTERSALYRRGSDCWDIVLSFFDPAQPMQTLRWLHRYTVDVSEVIPVTVGETRSWKAR